MFTLLSPIEIAKLETLAAGKDVAEVGIFRGYTSMSLARQSRSLRIFDVAGEQRYNISGQLINFRAGDFLSLTNNKPFCLCVSTQEIPLSREFVGGCCDLVIIDVPVNIQSEIVREYWFLLRRKGTMMIHDCSTSKQQEEIKKILYGIKENFRINLNLSSFQGFMKIDIS